MTKLQSYPTGTRIRIGNRTFKKTDIGTFWLEEHAIPGNCVHRPSASLACMEMTSRRHHRVLADSV